MSSEVEVSETVIPAEYFLILKEIRMLDKNPRRGKTHDQIWDLCEPDTEATAVLARLPIEVFCKIMGRHPIAVGSKKSTRNETSVAANA